MGLGPGQGEHHATHRGRARIGPDIEPARDQRGQVQRRPVHQRLDIWVRGSVSVHEREGGNWTGSTVRLELHFLGRGQATSIGHRQQDAIVIRFGTTAEGLQRGSGLHLRIDGLGVLMVVMVQDGLPRVAELGWALLIIGYGRTQVIGRWARDGVARAGSRTDDSDLRGRIIDRHQH